MKKTLWLPANLNDAVRFRLTDAGRAYVAELNRTHHLYSRCSLNYKPDADGWIESQLRDFAMVFGPTMILGFNQAVETAIQLRAPQSDAPPIENRESKIENPSMHTPTPTPAPALIPANPQLALGRLLALRRLAVAHQFDALDAANAIDRERLASDESYFQALASAELEGRRLGRQIIDLDEQIEALACQIEEAST